MAIPHAVSPEASALNRVADAIFQLAKQQGRHNKLTERQVEVAETLLAMQEANLRVTRHLEAELAARAAADRSTRQ